VGWYQKCKTILASAGPYASLHLGPDRQPCQHPTTQFLQPNQQRQSTEGMQHYASILLPHMHVSVTSQRSAVKTAEWFKLFLAQKQLSLSYDCQLAK